MNEFNPTAAKPAFLLSSNRERFLEKCRAVYAGLSLEEIKYVLTDKQFEALDLVLYKGYSQTKAASHLRVTPHVIVIRLQGAAKRVAQWRQWKAERENGAQ